MSEPECADLLRKLLAADDAVNRLESDLAHAKRDRADLLKQLDGWLNANGVRSVTLGALTITVAATPRWQTSVAQGVQWALKHGHHDVLTVLEREFSNKVQSFVDQGHKPPPWISKWPVLRLIIKGRQAEGGHGRT